MAKKARISLYLEDEEFKRQIKVAAAKRGIAITQYCAEAIEDRLIEDKERTIAECKSETLKKERADLAARMDRIRELIGPIGVETWELVEEGRRR